VVVVISFSCFLNSSCNLQLSFLVGSLCGVTLLKGKCALGHFYNVLVIKCPTHSE
jgi:hypothetical protein